MAQKPKTKWMRDAKWGLFTHYLAHVASDADTLMPKEQWIKKVNSFDVKLLGDQLSALKAPYFYITIGQGGHYFCTPNKAFDKHFGLDNGARPERDLVADIAAELVPRGIRTCVYWASYGLEEQEQDNKKGNLNEWLEVITEWSERWGKSVSAWWLDGYAYPSFPEYKAYINALRAGNKDALVATKLSTRLSAEQVLEDYIVGESGFLLEVSDSHYRNCRPGSTDQMQLHFLTFLGEFWGIGEPRFPAKLVTGWTQHINNLGGTVTWDIPLTDTGAIPDKVYRQLEAISRQVNSLSTAPMAEALGARGSVIPVNSVAGGNREADGARKLNPNTQWLCEAKWGLFSHYLPQLEGGKVQGQMGGKKWNKKVNSFRVSELGDQLEAINAPYFFITLGKDGDYYCSPNSSFEKLFGPGKGTLTDRDLVADLAADLIPRGIRLGVYLPALGSEGSAEDQEKYQQVITEWSKRWGKSISAWWVDDGKLPGRGVYMAYNNAFKAGNSDALIAYNAGRIAMTYNLMEPPTDLEDYFAGQVDWVLPVCQVRYFDKKEFWVGPDYLGDQLHFLTFLGSFWGVGEPRFPDDLVIGWTQHTNNYGGTVSYDVPLSDSGIIPENHFRQLKTLRKYIDV